MRYSQIAEHGIHIFNSSSTLLILTFISVQLVNELPHPPPMDLKRQSPLDSCPLHTKLFYFTQQICCFRRHNVFATYRYVHLSKSVCIHPIFIHSYLSFPLKGIHPFNTTRNKTEALYACNDTWRKVELTLD